MRRNSLLLLIIFTSMAMTSIAGHEKTSHGARSSGLSYADVCLRDFWSLRNNQAGLAWLNDPAAGVYYQNRFGMDALSFQSIGAAYPFSFGTVGVTADYYGSSAYNETTAGVAWAMKLHENLSAGVQLDYLSTFIDLERYNRASAVTFEIGFLYAVNEEIWIGAHVYNPLRQEMRSEAYEKIPSVFSLGTTFKITDGLLLAAEAEKTTGKQESYHLGVEYELLDKTFARIGISSGTNLLSFGFETAFNAFSIQIASSMHQTLGFSPMASMVYHF